MSLPDEIADRLMSFYVCPNTGRIIDAVPHDDKAICNCGKSNPKVPGGEHTERTATHLVRFLERSSAKAFREQREASLQVDIASRRAKGWPKS